MNALEILSDGPESPSPPGQAAPEVVAVTSPRPLPDSDGDDFGLLRALPLTISGGLIFWCVVLWWWSL